MNEDRIATQLGVLLERSDSTLNWVKGLDAKLSGHLTNCAHRHAAIDVQFAQSATENRVKKESHTETKASGQWAITTLVALIAAVVGWLLR